MNILDKANLAPFSFLTLPSDFEISDEPQIIFAPNGTGKTTLFNILIQQNSNKCEVYTYNSALEPTYKIIDGKKKKIIINPLTKNYTTELEKKNFESEKLNPKEILSIAYPGETTAKLKKSVTNAKVLKVINDNVFSLDDSLNDVEKKKLSYVLPYFNDIKKLIANRKILTSLTKEQKEADIDTMKLVDRKIIYDCYNVEQHKMDIEKDGCPLCGTKNSSIYENILKIRKEIIDSKFKFFEGFEFLKNLSKDVSPLEAIDSVIDGISSLSEEKILYLLMTKANSEIEKQVKESISNYNAASMNISSYLTERDAAYTKMSSSKETIQKMFPLIYPKSSIKFNDLEKTIEVTTPRNMDTYSEGEKHEMYSTIRELAIVGSDKEIVIADDPLTELDIANEYRNVFRFIELAHKNGKKVIIFTCSLNFINIANEYHPTLFARHYLVSNLDLANETLKLKLLKMDFPPNNGEGAYISLQQCIKEPDNSSLNYQVASLINERANLCISNTDNARKNDISKVLHYDCSSSSIAGTSSISNDQLFDLIDNFTTLPDYVSFTQLARDRICYLTALRVYVERKLFDYQQERIEKGLGNCFPNRSKPYLTRDKIKIVDEISDSFPIKSKYSNWDRSNLMCLKTMLNDNDHPYSLVLPISYAISLGNDSLENEILNVKEIFS